MTGWVCADCTTVYTVGAPRCPHCHSENHTEEGDMPKITVHGGASIAVGGVTVSATWENTETAGAVTEPPASTAPAPTEGGAPSPGNSSPASSETEPPNTEPSSSATPSRARTTASRSRKARTATSSAAGTDGDPEADTSATTSD